MFQQRFPHPDIEAICSQKDSGIMQSATIPTSPVSAKANEAIIKYTLLVSQSPHFRDVVLTTLQAERMARTELYARLESWGYRWDPYSGGWRERP